MRSANIDGTNGQCGGGQFPRLWSEQTILDEQASIGSQKGRPARNAQLNWLLGGYLYPGFIPGTLVDERTAQASLDGLQARARFEALLRGVVDVNVAEDALGAMLAWAADSRILERFQLERGTPRRYVNKILARFVQQEIHRQLTRKESPLLEGAPAPTIDPAVEVEVKDLDETCRKRLGPEGTRACGKGSPDEPPGRRYVREHRNRQRQWKQVEDLFPNTQRRPRKRRKQ